MTVLLLGFPFRGSPHLTGNQPFVESSLAAPFPARLPFRVPAILTRLAFDVLRGHYCP